MDLDLNKTVINVKLDGQEYKIGAPTVRQSEKYQAKIDSKAAKGKELDAFIDLLGELGLPRDVSENLDVVQIKKLSEGLLGLVEKK